MSKQFSVTKSLAMLHRLTMSGCWRVSHTIDILNRCCESSILNQCSSRCAITKNVKFLHKILFEQTTKNLKGTVLRDEYFFEGLNILIITGTFWVCSDTQAFKKCSSRDTIPLLKTFNKNFICSEK
jgi:hypothetical protein